MSKSTHRKSSTTR